MLPPDDLTFEVRVEGNIKTTNRAIQRYLTDYKDRKKAVVLVIQSTDLNNIHVGAPILSHIYTILYNTLQYVTILYNTL